MRTGPLQLFMTADAVGGVWSYALDLAEGLAAFDVATTLAVLGPAPAGDQLAEAARVRGLTVLETGLPLDWTASTESDLEAAARALQGLAHQFRADLVHLNSPTLAAFGPFGRPLVVACHSCLATWWAAVKSGPLPEDFAWRTRLVARGYAAADLLVAPTAAFAQATAETYGLAEAPRAVHNGRRPVDSSPSDADPPHKPFVFTAGRLWDEGKNLAALDAAAAIADLDIFAAGPLEGPAGNSIALSTIRPLGRLASADVARWTETAAAFVSTALYEPFGLSVLEAAQAGRPLVLSDISTFRELWDGAAVFVDPRDASAIAKALLSLMDEGPNAALAQAARARAAQMTVEAMAAGTMSIYEEAIRRAGASA